MNAARRRAAGLLLGGLLTTAAAPGQGPPRPREDAVLYAPVPDIEVVDAHGETLRLAQLWREKPLVLTMVFTRCVLICPPYIRSLREAVESVVEAGEELTVVVLSFDPSDTPRDMAAMARRHDLDTAPGWIFGVASPAAIEELARAVGFWSRWDEERAQFDHPAMLAAVDRGTVVRLLVGATVPRRRLREVVWELRHELVANYPLPSEKVLFRCFDYDPLRGGVTLDWGLLLLLAPAVVMLLATLGIFRRASGR